MTKSQFSFFSWHRIQKNVKSQWNITVDLIWPFFFLILHFFHSFSQLVSSTSFLTIFLFLNFVFQFVKKKTTKSRILPMLYHRLVCGKPYNMDLISLLFFLFQTHTQARNDELGLMDGIAVHFFCLLSSGLTLYRYIELVLRIEGMPKFLFCLSFFIFSSSGQDRTGGWENEKKNNPPTKNCLLHWRQWKWESKRRNKGNQSEISSFTARSTLFASLFIMFRCHHKMYSNAVKRQCIFVWWTIFAEHFSEKKRDFFLLFFQPHRKLQFNYLTMLINWNTQEATLAN